MEGSKKIVPVREWLYSGYYLGHVVRDLYPFWKEKCIEVVESKATEVILYGSIGGGKTYFANVLLLRKLYELACYGKEVYKELGLAQNSGIYFIYFSVNLTQAKFTGFQDLKSMVDSIPFFRNEFPRNGEVSSYLQFPNNIYVLTGSEFQHQLGMNVLGAVLDEANFRLAKDKFYDALELYNTINARRLSRFVKGSEGLGLSVLVSSAKDPTSFVETKIEEARSNPKIKVINVRGYEIKKNRHGIDVEGGFWVFVGAGYIKPAVINSVEDLKEVCKLLKIECSGDSIDSCINSMGELDKKYFVKVPEVYKDLFVNNVLLAVRDILGISVGSDRKLFKSVNAYEEALIKGDRIGFRDEVVELSMVDEVRLQDYFDLESIGDKGVQRWIHVDLGVKSGGDRTGMACSKIAGVKETEFGKFPIVEVEWMVGIEPSKKYKVEDEIPLWKIRDFLIWLKEKGVNIVKVSFDSFQSMDMVQILQRKGFNVEVLSVDRSDEQYLNLVNLYLERRIRHRECVLYRKELLNLEHDRVRRKVDHTAEVGKDVADAVCGAVWWACREFKVELVNLNDFIAFENSQYGISGWEDFFNYGKKRGKVLYL